MRRPRGDETADRLLHWTDSQKAAERLAANILAATGYVSVDPIHPLGGPDGLRDVVCAKDGKKWIAGVYFPNGKKSLSAVTTKFKHDLKGVAVHGADGFAFVTNQYLKASERESLIEVAGGQATDLLHRERIAAVLNSPQNYGTRLDFLDIEMSKEEQLAFFGYIAELTKDMQERLSELLALIRNGKLAGQIPLEDLERFKDTLHGLVGHPGSVGLFSPVDRLRPPIHELQAYAAELARLGDPGMFAFGSPVDRLRPPLDELRQYEAGVERLVGTTFVRSGLVSRLRPPLEDLQAYEEMLDRVIEKTHQLKREGPQAS